MIECNVIHQAYAAGVKNCFTRLSRIYPRMCLSIEDALLTGIWSQLTNPMLWQKLRVSSCESYNRQHGVDYRSCQFVNLYGPEITSTPMIATSYPLSSAVSMRPREMAWMRLLFGAAAPAAGILAR